MKLLKCLKRQFNSCLKQTFKIIIAIDLYIFSLLLNSELIKADNSGGQSAAGPSLNIGCFLGE